MHGAEERQKVRLDSEAANALVAGLGLLQFAAFAVPRDAHRDDAPLDVDLAPVERFQLTRANEEIDAESVETAGLERDERA